MPWFWNTDARRVGETSKWIDNITRLMLDVRCEAFSIGGSIIWWFPVEMHRLWCVSNTDTPTPAGRGWINAMHHCSELSSEICFVGIQCILYNYTSANLLCDCNLLIHTRKHFLQLFLLSHLFNFLLLVLVLWSLLGSICAFASALLCEIWMHGQTQ